MSQQEKIRERLNQYILKEGVTAKHIAKQLGIFESTLSRFRKNKVELYPETLNMIEFYLDQRC